MTLNVECRISRICVKRVLFSRKSLLRLNVTCVLWGYECSSAPTEATCNLFAVGHVQITRELKQTNTATPTSGSEARKIFLRNPRILLNIYLLWLPCMFLFSLKFRSLQRLLLNETMDVSSSNVGHVLQTAWKSHLRAGRHECQVYFTYSRALFVLCN